MEGFDLTGSKLERINKVINMICETRVSRPNDFFGRYRLQELLYDVLYPDMEEEDRKETEEALNKLRSECNKAKGKKLSFFNTLSSEFERKLFAFAKGLRGE